MSERRARADAHREPPATPLRDLVREPLVFERSRPGRLGVALPALDVRRSTRSGDPAALAAPTTPRAARGLRGRGRAPLHAPVDVELRHRPRPLPARLVHDEAQPELNERAARLPGFAAAHPMQPAATSQGSSSSCTGSRRRSPRSAGMDRVTLQPAAGAQGELTGIMMIRAYHAARGHAARSPDSRLGARHEPGERRAERLRGRHDPGGRRRHPAPETVAAAMDDDVAALMITNPNTLGIFERHIGEICDVVHEGGGLVYRDGANLNAMLGVTRPGDRHRRHALQPAQDLHDAARRRRPGRRSGRREGILAPFLPVPVVRKRGDGAFGSTRIGREHRPARAGSTATSACSCAPTRTSARSGPTA